MVTMVATSTWTLFFVLYGGAYSNQSTAVIPGFKNAYECGVAYNKIQKSIAHDWFNDSIGAATCIKI